MNMQQDAIRSMFEYHQAYKNADATDASKVEKSIAKLPESDRNYIRITGQMADPESVLPAKENISNKYTLRDLAMAYHYYLEEQKGNIRKDILIVQVDQFYKELIS